MSFSDNIKEWVSIDDEIKQLNTSLREKREQRNRVLADIIHHKTSNGLDNKTIKYNNQMLKFTVTRQYQSITYDFLRSCLTELIDEPDQVDLMMKYIKDKRNYKNVEDIKRFYT